MASSCKTISQVGPCNLLEKEDGRFFNLKGVGVTATVSVLAVLLQLLPGAAAFLQLEGQTQPQLLGFVQLLSGHLTHWSWDHLIWDLLVFVVCGARVEKRWGWQRYGTFLLSSMLLISAAVLWLEPCSIPYRGLSGVAVAVFTVALVKELKGSWFAAVVFCGLLAKVIFEGLTGQTLFADAAAAGFVVSFTAHVAGVVIGVVAAAPLSRLSGV